ncbi:MAG: hypothetical protein CME06_04350 [Gemmatimonadetes bacterium]|nr:hypothetical protein [Gemmatimonadota bacterium]
MLVPNASLGNELSKEPDSYFAVPPSDEVQIVREGVDRGGWIPGLQSPTDYPPERHSVYIPSEDTYFGLYEWNGENDYAVTARYWDEIVGIGFWSFEGTVNEPDMQDDSGRPSGHELDGGMMVAYHAHLDGDPNPSRYNVWVNTFDFTTQEWGTSLQVTEHPVANTFPFLDRSSDGKWMIVSQQGDGNADVVANISDDDGATWTQTTVATGVNDMWLLPSGAADPSNGDLYVAYNGDTERDNLLDTFIHRSTDGGATWSPAQTVAIGAPSKQCVEPSVVVDRHHRVHMVYQENMAPDASGGLSGLQNNGILIGPAQYVMGHFDGNTWVEEAREPLQDRAVLAGLPDSCEFEPTIENIATDSLTGLPQLGIYRGLNSDLLYVGFISSYMSVSAESGGWTICGPSFQVWMQSNLISAAGSSAGWSERTQVSDISIEDAMLDRQPMFVHTTHEVPTAGPGFLWSEMFSGAPPTDVMFFRPDSIDTRFDRVLRVEEPDSVYLGDTAEGVWEIINFSDQDELTVDFDTDCTWLQVAPDPLTLQPSSSAEVVLSYDSEGLPPGDHQCPIALSFSDLYELDLRVDVSMVSPLTVTIVDSPASVARGEMLRWRFSIANDTGDPRAAQGWFDAYLIGGAPHPWNPFDGPYEGTLPPWFAATAPNAVEIPMNAPLGGPYEICARGGVAPDQVWSEDCFEFSVVP